MAQDYDIVDRLEKQIEGSNLALAAVAEVLHKMDSEKAVTIVNSIKDQQATIQAMQKQLNLLKEGMDDEYPNEEDEDMNEENGEDKEEKEREEEEEEDGNGEMPELENMQKQINSLKAQLSGTFDMQKAVQNETEGRLRKMGFREETSLTRPQQIRYADTSMGVDGTAPITKANEGGDVVDQMMQLSYQDLRRLQENIESGDTDGVPRELLG